MTCGGYRVYRKKISHPQINGSDFSTVPLENIKYDYNIRGWLLGANRDYINHNTNAYLATDNFGFKLAYDKRTSIIDNNATNTFAKAQFNGNIAGTIWRSFADSEKRK